MQPSARSNSLGAFPVDPQYVQGGRPAEIWAHFRSGVVLEASRDRVRHYPGLSGAAPATLGLYLRGDELKTTANHVLDAGCGAGEGLRHLAARYRRVTGVDKDGKALAFARQIASEAHTVQADLLSTNLRCDPVQLVYVVDVLAHLEQPERTLWNLAQRMDGARALLVAEVKASAEQCLVPPARRAYSARGLHATLVRGGFLIEQWSNENSPFLVASAVAHRDPAAAMLFDAEAAFERGAIQLAEEVTRRSCQSSLPALRLEALLALARIQMETARRDVATATLIEARAIDPEDARPPAALARLAHLAGAEAEAYSLAEEAMRLDLTEIAAVTAMGGLSHESDARQAMDSWLVAHALAPDHRGIAMRLCEAAVRVGDCGTAISVLERLRKYSSATDAARGSMTLAWLLARVGRPLQAEIEARLVEAESPDSQELKALRLFLRSIPPGTAGAKVQ